MADRYTSQLALVLADRVDDVGEVVRAAIDARDIDRASAVRGDGAAAQEVNWGGRMDKGVVRQLTDPDDGAVLLRTEAYVGGASVSKGMQRQAQLLQALSRQLRGRIRSVRDLSALAEHDEAWVNRVAIGAVEPEDAIAVRADGEGTWWVRTHGAARFDVPDLELYGLIAADVDAAGAALRHVHAQLLDRGITQDLALPDGTPVYLVPVLDAWRHVSLDWPGVGRAGQDRGPGLDGPRATLSVLHRPRLGRYRKDLDGVLAALRSA